MILGIDPGLTGALALLDGDRCIDVIDMPISAKTVGKGNEVNAYLLGDILSDLKTESGGDLLASVEQVGPMPGQGVTSMFGFGRSAGVLDGVLAAMGIPVNKVSPARWKKAMGLSGRDKDVARTMAINTFPEMAHMLARKKDTGRAEAMLIAAYSHGELLDRIRKAGF